MTGKNDGGPAFPEPRNLDMEGLLVEPFPGMTLRQYFAAHAPAVVFDGGLSPLPEGETQEDAHKKWIKHNVEAAYEWADAMIEAGESEAKKEESDGE